VSYEEDFPLSDIIDFLEKMGQECHLRDATDAELAEALEDAGVESVAQAALLSRDPHALETFLGTTPNACCLVDPGHEEEEEEDDDDEDDEDDEDDDDDDDIEIEEEEDKQAEQICAASVFPSKAGEG
jgi:hypothetical protein